jgi:uncharacterized protein
MLRVFNHLFRFIIRCYQIFLSPFLGQNCRFQPTCSHYAMDAYKELNFFRATLLVIKRILNCHPWGGSGYDPVPKK